MDQNSNPQDTNNNVFAQNEGQPFARRTVSWAFNLGLVILVMGLFAGWYFTASDEPDTTQADPQMPGNQYEESSVKGGVYDFFMVFLADLVMRVRRWKTRLYLMLRPCRSQMPKGHLKREMMRMET